EEERAAKAKYWKLPVCYDDDDDEERSDSLDDNTILGLPSFSTITPDEPVLSTEEPDNSLRGIADDILLTINQDDLREKLLNVNLLISKIEALNVNPTPSSD
nr:hypothetical protein [Tanacetum cinerariifolium]